MREVAYLSLIFTRQFTLPNDSYINLLKTKGVCTWYAQGVALGNMTIILALEV